MSASSMNSTNPIAAPQVVVEQHGALVYGMCRRLADDPDDAYQTIWEKVLKALPRFDPDGRAPLAAWIATIARRTLIDRHRRRVVRGEIVPLDGLADPGDVEAVVAERQVTAQLEALLRGLPPAQRHVVVGHHVYGLSLEELAEEAGVAVGTIKSRLHRGRAQLASRMGAR